MNKHIQYSIEMMKEYKSMSKDQIRIINLNGSPDNKLDDVLEFGWKYVTGVAAEILNRTLTEERYNRLEKLFYDCKKDSKKFDNIRIALAVYV